MQLKKIPLLVTNKISDIINLKKYVDELYESLNETQIENFQLKQKINDLTEIVDEERKIANENVIIYNKKIDQMTNDMSIMVTALKELYTNVDQIITLNNYSSDTYYDMGWGNKRDDDDEGH